MKIKKKYEYKMQIKVCTLHFVAFPAAYFYVINTITVAWHLWPYAVRFLCAKNFIAFKTLCDQKKTYHLLPKQNTQTGN